MKITYFQDVSEDTISDKFVYVKTFVPVSEYKNLLYSFVEHSKDYRKCMFFKSVRHSSEIFIGFGLGGFWAYYNAMKFNQFAILINPILRPSRDLKQHLDFLKMDHEIEQEAFLQCEKELEEFPRNTKEIHSFSFIGTSKKIDQEKIYIPDESFKVIQHTYNTPNRFPYGIDLDDIISLIKIFLEHGHDDNEYFHFDGS